MRNATRVLCLLCTACVLTILWFDYTNSSLVGVQRGWELGCDLLALCGMVFMTTMMDRITR